MPKLPGHAHGHAPSPCVSAFAQVAASLLDNGYNPIPIQPGQKRPGSFVQGRWLPMAGWVDHAGGVCDERIDEWSLWPNAGVGIALTDTLGAMDFDHDTANVHDDVRSILAGMDGTICKRQGSKGYVQYFQLEPGLTTQRYRINGSNALEFMARGTQTVLPPSVHPDTGQPYKWLTPDTLEDTPLDELPFLDRSTMNEVERVMRRAGW